MKNCFRNAFGTLPLASHVARRGLCVRATNHLDAAKQTRMLCRLDTVALLSPGGDEMRESLDTVTRASRCLHRPRTVLSRSKQSTEPTLEENDITSRGHLRFAAVEPRRRRRRRRERTRSRAQHHTLIVENKYKPFGTGSVCLGHIYETK